MSTRKKLMQKDVNSKLLEAQNDVFADIFNHLLFNDDEAAKIVPEQLKDEPTETFYHDADGNARNLYRDIFKSYASEQQMLLVSLGLENETKIERPMPIRVMGYAYTHYKRQLDEYNQNKAALMRLKKEAQSKEALDFIEQRLRTLGEFVLTPALTLVLCYDSKEWNQPKTLRGLTNHNPYSKYMQDYAITVVDIKYLPKNVRERFTSDFRYITNILCEGEILDEDKVKELVHPVETLDMLIAYTNDIRYKNIRKRILTKTMEGEKISMGNFLDELDRKNTIDNARRYHMKGVSDEIIVETISEELNIDITEAREIFNNEVKKTA